MANSLNKELTGKIVILKAESLKPEYRDLKWRRFQVEATSPGSGAHPYTAGTALFGVFLEDGEYARISGMNVERIEEGDGGARPPVGEEPASSAEGSGQGQRVREEHSAQKPDED